jgi:ankyrin repeat protein
VELLIAHKAEVNIRNKIGWTPRAVAAIYYHKEVVELLRRHGAEE